MVGRLRTLVLAVLCVAALAGCGSSQDETVSDVAREFHAAVASGDGAAACEVLVLASRSELEQSAGKECAQAILEEQIPEVTGEGETSVFETMAQVDYDGDTVFLARMPDGWRVLAAGCTPRDEAPYDCVVKGA